MEYDRYGQSDEQEQKDGDSIFYGVDMQADPATLAPGYCAFARNKRFRNKSVPDRGGCVHQTWADSVDMGTYLGCCVFRQAGGYDWLMLATDDGVLVSRPGATPELIGLPEGVTLTDRVRMFQIFDKVIMCRGESLEPLQWIPATNISAPYTNDFSLIPSPTSTETATLSEVDIENSRFKLDGNWADELKLYSKLVITGSTGNNGTYELQADSVYNNGEDVTVCTVYQTIPDATADGTVTITIGSGLSAMPKCSQLLHFNERAWVPYERYNVALSDVLRINAYDPNDEFYLNQGGFSDIVRLYPYGNAVVLGLMDDRIWWITGANGDPASMAQDQLTDEFGLRAYGGVLTWGRDVWILTDYGILRASKFLADAVGALADPVSREIQPVIDAVNWSAAEYVSFAAWDNKAYCAFPINDASDHCNVVCVFDGMAGPEDSEGEPIGAWAGIDTGEYLRVVDFFKMRLNGKDRLYYVDPDGKVFLYESTFEDTDASDTSVPIDSLMITRGYRCGTNEEKQWDQGVCNMATQNPTYTISQIVNGNYTVGE